VATTWRSARFAATPEVGEMAAAGAADSLSKVARRLCRRVERLSFGAPVTHVYNPLVYAWTPHQRYLERYGAGHKEVLMLGMNPGPLGMAQTGVPFGEVAAVRDWLALEGRVGKPAREHPKRPILGFACERSEVSGARLWGWASRRFGAPRRFFRRFFVYNYCPLVFMQESGRNVTPDKLKARERAPLVEACDAALREVVAVVRPRLVVGIGVYAEQSARRALADSGAAFGRILHPSPASPLANRGWEERAEQGLRELGVRVVSD